MTISRFVLVLAGTLLALSAGCGARFFDRWTGEPVVSRGVAAPPDTLWQQLSTDLNGLDLVVEEVRPEDRMIQFGWITAPGDGRLYLRCDASTPVGSASLRPRVWVRPTEGGSRVVIATETRSTAGTACESTGRFEDWLMERLEPTLARAAEAGSAAPVLPAEDR